MRSMTLSLMRVRRLTSATLRPASLRARASVSPMLKPQTSFAARSVARGTATATMARANARPMTAPLRPRYLGLANRGVPGRRAPGRPGMSQENPGFRLQATRVASTADRSSADGPAGMSAQQAARGTGFRAPEAGGHLPRSYGFELVEQLADELRQVSLASHAVPAFDRDLEDSDPRLGSPARGSGREPPPAPPPRQPPRRYRRL